MCFTSNKDFFLVVIVKDGDSLLMVAASGGHVQVVNKILDLGTDAIDQQNTVSKLHIAV